MTRMSDYCKKGWHQYCREHRSKPCLCICHAPEEDVVSRRLWAELEEARRVREASE